MICIRRSAVEALISHARTEAPRECCGLLVGQPGLVERIVPATNVRASETSYLIDPRDHFVAIRAARAEGLSVIGGYHSHPRSQALPSATDLAESAGQDFLYVIAAPAARGGWRLGAFFIDTRNFVESPLVPVA
ncbi:MAG: Mov34/MPN/PAD-1 family protein [Vicinamibacterales bacterium]